MSEYAASPAAALAETSVSAASAVTGTATGGPRDRREILEHVLGWTLTVVLAMLVVQLHLM